jgi:hypothetical protein
MLKEKKNLKLLISKEAYNLLIVMVFEMLITLPRQSWRKWWFSHVEIVG